MKGVIAVPTSSHFYLPKKFALDLMELRLVFDKFYPDNTFIFSEYAWIEDARNTIWEKAKKHNPDWILWIDSDMTFTPKDGLRLVEWIKQGYDFVTGLYFAGAQPHLPLIYKKVDKEVTYYNNFPRDKTFFEVEACGFGFCIQSKKVLEKLSNHPFNRMHSNTWNNLGEDLSFCKRAKVANFNIHCDSTISPGHIRLATIDKEYLDSGQMFKIA